MRAYIVVDLGFGDAGKGLVTDYLTRRFNANLVVRYNGGAQAGHNVVALDGRHHTFSQFGSGTFVPGTKTFLSKYVVVHPGALLVEGDALASIGVSDAFARLRISDQALIITPFHQAANRIREMLRGDQRHGSCGVGVGETVEDSLAHPDSVRAGNLADPKILLRKLQWIYERKRAELLELGKDQIQRKPLAREWQIFESADLISRWMQSIARINELGLVVADSILHTWLNQTETTIFEGAQGILLDADAGFHPFTTWSNCTTANARKILSEFVPNTHAFTIGILRSYAVRHGVGPLPTETNAFTPILSEHNQTNEWQGTVRYGWFDAMLARYATRVTGQIDAIAITHMDVLSRMKTWSYCNSYQNWDEFDRLRSASLERKLQITQSLANVTPIIESCSAKPSTVIEKIESLIEHSVDMISNGQHATDVKIIGKPLA